LTSLLAAYSLTEHNETEDEIAGERPGLIRHLDEVPDVNVPP
jgi:hypothetical protein